MIWGNIPNPKGKETCTYSGIRIERQEQNLGGKEQEGFVSLIYWARRVVEGREAILWKNQMVRLWMSSLRLHLVGDGNPPKFSEEWCQDQDDVCGSCYRGHEVRQQWGDPRLSRRQWKWERRKTEKSSWGGSISLIDVASWWHIFAQQAHSVWTK